MNEKPEILIISDRFEEQKAQIRLLKRANYRVRTAGSGAEGIRALREKLPDLVLLDEILPDSPGTAVCNQIKTNPALEGVFVVMLSEAQLGTGPLHPIRDNSADGSITRPISNRELLARVLAFLRTKNAETALHNQVGQWRVTLDAIKDSIFILDPDWTITRCNQAAVHLVGVPVEKIIGRKYPRIVHGTPNPLPGCPLWRVKETMQRETAVLPFGEGWMEVRSDPILDEKGDLQQVVHTLVDVTERKRLSDANTRSQQLLVSLSQAAQAVQRGRSLDEIYHTIGEEISRLGYTTTIMILSPGRDYLQYQYSSLTARIIRAGERLTGLSATDYRFPIPEGGFYWRVLDERGTILSDIGGGPIQEALPAAVRPLANRLGAILNLGRAIYAPLAVGEDLLGLLAVLGQGLSEADIPAITTFAQQAAIALKNTQAAEALRTSEQHLKLILESTSDGIFDWDLITNQVIFNPRYFTMLGYEPDDLPHTFETYQNLVHPADLKRSEGKLKRYLSGESKDGAIEIRFKTKGGDWKWLYSRGKAVAWDEHGKPIRFVGTNVDIDSRIQMENELRQERDRAQLYLDLAAVMFITLDNQGRVILANQKACEVLKVSELDLLGKNWFDTCIPDDSREDVRSVFKQLIGEEVEPVEFYENQVLTPDGGKRLIAWHNSVLRDGTGRIIGIIGSGEDITDRKRVEENLRQRGEELAQLTIRLAETEDSERRRIARELHDQAGQTMALLNLNMNLLKERLGTDLNPDLEFQIDTVMELLSDMTRDIRDIMDDLRPSILDDYGLFAALNWFADKFTTRTNISTTVYGNRPDPRLAPRIESALFRITQEALTNVTRHAMASQVVITLQEDRDNVFLVISDDGVGFEKLPGRQPAQQGGWGLVNMRERVETFGGNLTIEPIPGEGTTLEVRVPRG